MEKGELAAAFWAKKDCHMLTIVQQSLNFYDFRNRYTAIFPSASGVFVAATIPSITAMSHGTNVQQSNK